MCEWVKRQRGRVRLFAPAHVWEGNNRERRGQGEGLKGLGGAEGEHKRVERLSGR